MNASKGLSFAAIVALVASVMALAAAPRLIALPLLFVLAKSPALVLAALAIAAVIAASFILPLRALSNERSRASRIRMLVGAFVASVSVFVVGQVTSPSGGVFKRTSRPASCEVSTTDTAAIGAECSVPLGVLMDADAVEARGGCPRGYSCHSRLQGQGMTCQIGCYHDCQCPTDTRCVNGTCQRGGALPP